MRKKFFLLLFILFTVGTMQAQILATLLFGNKLNSDNLKFGVVGGINGSTISGLETKSYAPYFGMGFYFDIKVKKNLNFYTGFMPVYSYGVKNLTANDVQKIGAALIIDAAGENVDGDYTLKINSFILPLMARYNFKHHMFAEAGGQMGLSYRSTIQFDTQTDEHILLTLRQDNSDQLNKITAGLMVGIGYRLMKGEGMVLKLNYYYGLVNVYKGLADVRNNSLLFQVEIKIGAEKKNCTKN